MRMARLFAEVPQAFQSRNRHQRVAPMLAALAGMGAGRDLVVMLVEFAGVELPLDERRFLIGADHRRPFQRLA